MTAPHILRAAEERKKLNIACIGVAGKGGSDTDSVGGQNIIALCDVDKKRLDAKMQKFPGAKGYQDYRKLFEEVGKDLDAVTVSTPDHHHAIASAYAMKMGKHVFCQKPLVQTVYEARVLRKLAKEKNLATQMGNQGSAGDGLRRAVEVIQAGTIGKVSELHVWSNRPVWPQGIDRPPGADPVPPELDWDCWIGPAPMRPYKGNRVYHDFNWRGWFDFGTGALGDMACHTVNMPFRALKLGYPTAIECEDVFGAKSETYPKSSRIRFEFPERENMAPVKFWWYDGDPKSQNTFRPNPELTKEILDMQDGKLPGSGCLLIGDKGKIFSPDDYGSKFYLKLKDEGGYTGGDKHAATLNIPKTIPRSPGHVKEWIDMIHGGPPAYSNYDIAAYLTEIILLGCIALRHGVKKPIQWDGPNAKAKNADVSHFVKRDYRKGWELPV